MVKNEEMHYIDSDDQEDIVGGKKPDDKWVIKILNFLSYVHYIHNMCLHKVVILLPREFVNSKLSEGYTYSVVFWQFFSRVTHHLNAC